MIFLFGNVRQIVPQLLASEEDMNKVIFNSTSTCSNIAKHLIYQAHRLYYILEIRLTDDLDPSSRLEPRQKADLRISREWYNFEDTVKNKKVLLKAIFKLHRVKKFAIIGNI